MKKCGIETQRYHLGTTSFSIPLPSPPHTPPSNESGTKYQKPTETKFMTYGAKQNDGVPCSSILQSLCRVRRLHQFKGGLISGRVYQIEKLPPTASFRMGPFLSSKETTYIPLKRLCCTLMASLQSGFSSLNFEPLKGKVFNIMPGPQ